MNFNQWYLREEPDELSELDKLDMYRASYNERRSGIRESSNAVKRRLATTRYYCKSQGKTYNELIKTK